jgi:flagellar biosynthesis/type III secretory pathway protein FliH
MTAPRISVHPAFDALPPYPDLREENAALRRQIVEQALLTARMRRDVLEASEGELLKLAVAIGERIARQELRTDPKIVLGWVREAIDVSTTKDNVIVALAPDLAATLAPSDWEAIAVGPVRVETDASLAPFHCEVRAGASAVEVNVAERVAAMSRELGVST